MTEWTIQKLIQWTTQHFTSKGIESSRLDTELLLAQTLKCGRLDLYLRFDQPLSPEELGSFKSLVLRRSQREPVAYILGRQEFYNREFEVKPGVLIPRPETEHLVDEALLWIKTSSQNEIRVLDVGSGSGVIGVSLSLEDERVLVWAVELSPQAYHQTKTNAEKFAVSHRVTAVNQNFSEWVGADFDVVVSNPPYIGRTVADTLKPDVVQYEPEEALFGGARGDETLREWLPKMVSHLKPKGLLLCEIGYDQSEVVKEYAESLGLLSQIEILKDYSGHPRILKAFKKG